jgi:hypothetical protein
MATMVMPNTRCSLNVYRSPGWDLQSAQTVLLSDWPDKRNPLHNRANFFYGWPVHHEPDDISDQIDTPVNFLSFEYYCLATTFIL